MTQDELKTLVGRAALEFVVPGSVVGVGTGSTVNKFIDALATMKERIAGAVSSSAQSTARLQALGIRVLRRQRGRTPPGLHRRRRRDRRPRLHDQGRRRGADAREDRRRPGRALRLHRRREQARGRARPLSAAGGGDRRWRASRSRGAFARWAAGRCCAPA